MYRDAINEIPEEHWRSGDVDYLIPARQVYHVIEAAEFYSRDTPARFNFGHRFGADWEGAKPEQLPTKQQAMVYLEEIQKRVDSWLRGIGDSDLLSEDTEYLWKGTSFLDRALYLLQHNRQHIGEINAELRRRGLPRIKWR